VGEVLDRHFHCTQVIQLPARPREQFGGDVKVVANGILYAARLNASIEPLRQHLLISTIPRE
jgi:hypothetical protein